MKLRCLMSIFVLFCITNNSIASDDSTMVYSCTEGKIVLALKTHTDSVSGLLIGPGVENFDVENLIDGKVTTNGKNERYQRTSSRSVNRKCGGYSIRISAAWLNEDSLGMNGAFVFPVAEIHKDGKNILKRTIFGECDSKDHNALSSCKSNWGVAVIYYISDHTLRVRRLYEDIYENL